MADKVYLSYEEYQKYGGTLPQNEFTLYEFKCRKRIDYLTDSRVQNMADVPTAVKLCMITLINIDSNSGVEAQIANPVVTSFNTDGYSESYGKAIGVADAEASMVATIKSNLYGELDDNGVPLLYRGVGV